MSQWLEIGDRVYTRRYRFFDQQVGALVGDDGVLVVDTRTTAAQAEELLRDLRALTPLPVRLVVNTHFHYDHCFGNRTMRPAEIWGHERCARGLVRSGELQRARVMDALPDLAAELSAVVIDPPERTFTDSVEIDAGGRPVELRYLGRGHTDSDIVVRVLDARVLFAGDLVENGAPPSFGDGYPLDWPDTAEALLGLVDGPVVPGHGAVGDRAFVEEQLAALRDVASLARDVHAGHLAFADALIRSPFPGDTAREPLERALSQLRGELD